MLNHQHHGHGNHGHDHEGLVGPHTHLTSVGIDIGSSTSHLMFSRLLIGYPSLLQRKPIVVDREVIARSRILLTPFSGDWKIEAEPLKQLVNATFEEAGLNREQIDTGAVIITGEAARRENAAKIAEVFADEAGKFVCATAGPTLETIMAAHGSGAVLASREQGTTLLNIDVGGGTTKISLIQQGSIRATSAVNIGARLVAYDSAESVIRLEKAGRRFLADLGQKLDVGGKLPHEVRELLASRMAQALFEALTERKQPWDGFYVGAALGELPKVDGILFSGGVSEYIYGREQRAFGDLGPDLGREIRKQAGRRGFVICQAGEGIRATVIGASQYTVQLSGETIFIPDTMQLPVRNLRVFVAHVDWEAPVSERAEAAVLKILSERDPEVRESPFVLAFSTPPFVGYGSVQELARGIDGALAAVPAPDRPAALVFVQNVGQVVGGMLSAKWNMPCIDEVSLTELDFIDVGEVVESEGFVPVVIKSLAFGV
ncbi:MAG TPA: ethanolamine ammonia-lyase reactivating factor EutA [Candidatus Binatia bacterium]|nr:ethanolamine ammonia-lyase reactivating factor EutA [Candidatus Binatia bacterium]